MHPPHVAYILCITRVNPKSQMSVQTFKEAPDIAANQVKGVCDTNKEPEW